MVGEPEEEFVRENETDLNETDLDWLQEMLDRSYATAGDHLLAIHTPAARLSAREVVRQLPGMQIFVVATVSRDGRPFSGPVDAFLYRARVYFGTAPNAARARHLRRAPVISATHVRGESLVVTVHGTARPLELSGRDAGFEAVVEEHYGFPFDQWGGDGEASVWAIEPERMFAADMSVHQTAAS